MENIFMKIALNGATTMHAGLETDIKAASEAGYDLIEIWAAKLREFLKTKTTDDLKNLLDEANLKPYSINSIEHITFRTAEDYEKIKEPDFISAKNENNSHYGKNELIKPKIENLSNSNFNENDEKNS